MANKDKRLEALKAFVEKDRQGFKAIPTFVNNELVRAEIHVAYGTNGKVGNCFTFNTPIAHSCRDSAECKQTGLCYCKGSTYEFIGSLSNAYENIKFYLTYGAKATVEAIEAEFAKHPKCKKMRWNGSGDIFSYAFFRDVMMELARKHEDMTFWSYTKKYSLINRYFDEHGIESKPKNLVILFSVWTDTEGKRFVNVPNPYNFPLAYFIPVSMIKEFSNVPTYICECGKPWRNGHCDECVNGCPSLKNGESVGFIEHSTSEATATDKLLKERREYCKAYGITTKEAYIKEFGMDDIFAN